MRPPTSSPVSSEQYTYSAVWLVFGVVLLLIGIWLRSQPARLASAAVVIITVLKVFVADLANLGGIYRGLSFIGLLHSVRVVGRDRPGIAAELTQKLCRRGELTCAASLPP